MRGLSEVRYEVPSKGDILLSVPVPLRSQHRLTHAQVGAHHTHARTRTHTHTHAEKDTRTHTHTHTERYTHTERERERERNTHTNTNTQKHTHTHTEKDTHTHTRTYTHLYMQPHTYRFTTAPCSSDLISCDTFTLRYEDKSLVKCETTSAHCVCSKSTRLGLGYRHMSST